MAWARVMRGTRSIAKQVISCSTSASTTLGSRWAYTNDSRMLPLRILRISEGLGDCTLSTTSALPSSSLPTWMPALV